jgi:ketosteroid isomerase-like protein
LPGEAVEALLEAFVAVRASGESRELDFRPWGGAYNRRRPEDTTFVHRDERFLLKHAVALDPDAPSGARAAARQAATRSWASVHAWASGRVFQNFADPELQRWAAAYYGPNYHRLARVKARYDLSNLFRFRSRSRPVPFEEPMSDANKAVVRRLVAEVLNGGRLEMIDELYAPELAVAARGWIAPFRTSFPDVHMEILELIAEGDKVVGRFTCSATHLGDWLGHAPTGRRFERVDEVAIFRLRDGRIARAWSLEDSLSRLEQLGLVHGTAQGGGDRL